MKTKLFKDIIQKLKKEFYEKIFICSSNAFIDF